MISSWLMIMVAGDRRGEKDWEVDKGDDGWRKTLGQDGGWIGGGKMIKMEEEGGRSGRTVVVVLYHYIPR